MAGRKVFAKIQAVFGLLGVVAILVTYSIITGWNPLPSWGSWIANAASRSLSKPATTWVKRAGNEPRTAAVVGSFVVVATEGSVEVHGLALGEKIWEQQASWAVAAGDSRPVVVAGRVSSSGFDVYDVASGVRLWGSSEKVGVWAYANEVLLLRCGSDSSCVLRAVDPADGSTKWTTKVHGLGRNLLGPGHALAANQPMTSSYAKTLTATPDPAPTLIGLPMSGEMHVINTSTGHQLDTFPVNARSRSIVADGVVVTTSSAFVNGQCEVSVSGHDPSSGATRWTKTGYDAKTTSGMACDERRDPVGGGHGVYAVDGSGRDTVLSVTSGKVLFRANKGQKIVATDGDLAVVRAADKKSVFAVDLGSGTRIWSRATADSALVGITPSTVLVADPANEKLAAMSRSGSSAYIDVSSGATVLGLGAHQLIINIGRSFGPLFLTGAP
jgi:outer membrane protein assembly factor BamB